jgi:hypothetical protein
MLRNQLVMLYVYLVGKVLGGKFFKISSLFNLAYIGINIRTLNLENLTLITFKIFNYRISDK